MYVGYATIFITIDSDDDHTTRFCHYDEYLFYIKDAIFEHTSIPGEKDIHQFVVMHMGAQISLTAMGPCLKTKHRPSIAIVTHQVS